MDMLEQGVLPIRNPVQKHGEESNYKHWIRFEISVKNMYEHKACQEITPHIHRRLQSWSYFKSKHDKLHR